MPATAEAHPRHVCDFVHRHHKVCRPGALSGAPRAWKKAPACRRFHVRCVRCVEPRSRGSRQ
ncbi:hypothetical protein DIE08_16010 [Burkholderia sp. Bp9004]|nr:hypothetical protein DIE08_16010 [Burkholderia sp. Bp9004]